MQMPHKPIVSRPFSAGLQEYISRCDMQVFFDNLRAKKNIRFAFFP